MYFHCKFNWDLKLTLIINRPVAYGKFPVLIEGATSTGKTSLISYLGRITGNKIVRINNHEHTDLQEYLGSYASDKYGMWYQNLFLSVLLKSLIS